MRAWIDAILNFITTATLTDEEYAAMNISGMTSMLYNQAAYDQISLVLASRESISGLQDRLIGVFKAKGLEVNPAQIGHTNIYLGSPL